MIGFSLILATGTLVVGLILAVIASHLATMRSQIVALVLVATLLPLGSVVVGGHVMFTDRDATVLLALCAASLAVMVGAGLIARRVMAPIAEVQKAAQSVAKGDLSARAPESGTREMMRLAAAFNEMVSKLEELHNGRTRLVAWVSHDLRTPVASLQAMLEAEQDGIVDAHHYLGAMHDQVRRLAHMVDDLFEAAQLHVGAMTLNVQPTTVRSLVERCTQAFDAEARTRGVFLSAHVADDVRDVRCAPDKVDRILENLIANALRHTPAGGTIHICASLHGVHDILLQVADTGDGLAEATLARMFDHFWRKDPARGQDGAGAGLGLAIARALVEAHGGRLWAEDRPTGGAILAFTLPERHA